MQYARRCLLSHGTYTRDGPLAGAQPPQTPLPPAPGSTTSSTCSVWNACPQQALRTPKCGAHVKSLHAVFRHWRIAPSSWDDTCTFFGTAREALQTEPDEMTPLEANRPLMTQALACLAERSALAVGKVGFSATIYHCTPTTTTRGSCAGWGGVGPVRSVAYATSLPPRPLMGAHVHMDGVFAPCSHQGPYQAYASRPPMKQVSGLQHTVRRRDQQRVRSQHGCSGSESNARPGRQGRGEHTHWDARCPPHLGSGEASAPFGCRDGPASKP